MYDFPFFFLKNPSLWSSAKLRDRVCWLEFASARSASRSARQRSSSATPQNALEAMQDVAYRIVASRRRVAGKASLLLKRGHSWFSPLLVKG